MGPNFMDETDCGSFFDQIDDLIQFPPENECASGGSSDLVSSDDCKDFPSMWNDALPQCGPLFSGNHGNNVSDLSAELSVPYEDILQMEWLSTFVEDSFSGGGMTLIKENLCANKEPSPSQSQTSSPVSVLERSSSSSGSSCCGKKTTPLGPTQRARSKRPRPASFNPRTAIQPISSPPSSVEPHQPFLAPGFSSESENFADLKKIPKPSGAQLKKKKKKKIKVTSAVDPEEDHQNPPVQAVRKCLHCEITKTPQWRAGPMGPKTLCNACGVRYKSGRLFPEYRPAASPTFVQSMHSSSHKKVLEMRNKALPGITATSLTTAKSGLLSNP